MERFYANSDELCRAVSKRNGHYEKKKMTITLFKTDPEKEIEKTTRRMVQKRRKLLKIG